jgi:tetratricopeptide (TPR) repeat protein
MYELGYGHALSKPTLVLNQDVQKAPFDVRDFRQIVYDRKRLVKDCRPSLISALCDVFGNLAEIEISVEDDEDREGPEIVDVEPVRQLPPLRPNDATLALLQEQHVRLQFANSKGNAADVRNVAGQVKDLLRRITVGPGADPSDIRNTAAAAGNCAVEVEKAGLGEEAEDLYRRAIGLFPEFAGLHLQYADYLVDADRAEEAREELRRATALTTDDTRIERVRMKLALTMGTSAPDVLDGLRRRFDADPGNRQLAAAYLLYLDRTGAPMSDFEEICQRWHSASPPDKKHEAERALADHLAARGDRALREKAIEIYETLLKGRMDPPDRHAVLHNVATLYSALDKDDLALAKWTEAYQLNPNHPAVKAAFSQNLASWGKLEHAMAVIQGKPLPTD